MSLPPDPCPLVSRRRFIAALGATATVTAAGRFGISLWGRAPAHAATAPPPGAFGPGSGARTLVVVELGGGNDGLNTVVPHASARYRDLRGDLAVPEPIDLDGEVGLHPGLGYVAERYAGGDVAVVEGVGYPDADLSHFASMSTWWSAVPGAAGRTGWLGRALDGTVGETDPLAGVGIGPGPHPALAAERAVTVAIQDHSGLVPALPRWIDDRAELVGMWSGFAQPEAEPGSPLDRARAAIAGTVAAAGEVAARLGPAPAEPPGSEVEGYLDVAASLIASARPPRVVVIHGWGDFDTHDRQASRHEALLGALDAGLERFFGRLAGAGDRVLVMTTSEFGRRAASNGGGTDHGTASSHLLIGAGVAGGRYGVAPDLGRLDPRGNPIHTVDFRSLYATVLDGWLAVPHAAVLDGSYETLPLLERTLPPGIE